MFEKKTWFNWQVIFAGLWLLLTISLTAWWMVFAFSIIAKTEGASDNHRTMLLYEGATLLALLVLGGFFLIYFILREKKRNYELQKFFSDFSHDIKTALAGVRLQTESLKADLAGSSHASLVDRLLQDTSRLHVKLVNSLHMGRNREIALFLEAVSLKDTIEFIRESWPKIQIHMIGDALLRADARVLEMVFHNIIHNAIAHGQSSRLDISIKEVGNSKIQIDFQDDGTGFEGDVAQLGKMFYRHNPSSGTGLGLYTCREYIRRMNGEIEFSPQPVGASKGFLVRIHLPGELTSGVNL